MMDLRGQGIHGRNVGNTMIEIFYNTLPFFALIGLGYGAARIGLFSKEATTHLTGFVFYFALSAMLFRFSATLSLEALIDWTTMAAYLAGSLLVYLIVAGMARWRGVAFESALIEAQSAVIGNMGWMALAMLPILLGVEAIAPVMLVLIVDLMVFGPLVVILIVGSRDGRFGWPLLITIGRGLLKNPMIMSISSGLAWASLGWPVPQLADRFLEILAGASTPGALFAIGASMAYVSATSATIPAWLSLSKLVLHPLAVAVMAFGIFSLDPFVGAVLVASAAMPVAGNVYMIAAHYGIATDRVSMAILISTSVSVLTIPLWIQWALP